MNTYLIDINCDLGEGIGNDALIMPFLSSCNIACGAHAGSDEVIKKTIALAIRNKTRIGAHPSFPDRENFGRNEMHLPSGQLTQVLLEQISAVKKLSDQAGAKLFHVKPHGALYNMAAVNEQTAQAVIDSIAGFNDELFLYAPFGSVIARMAADQKIPVKFEVFADRNYNDDLTLVSRKQSNAVLHEPDQIAEHVIGMITQQKVKTIGGKMASIRADTVCIHGDNPNAVAIVTFLARKLKSAGINVEKS